MINFERIDILIALHNIIIRIMEDDLVMNKLPLPKYFDGI